MSIRELKEFIKDLPDDMQVVVTTGEHVRELDDVVLEFPIYRSGKITGIGILLSGE